jgi:hypothetical protein
MLDPRILQVGTLLAALPALQVAVLDGDQSDCTIGIISQLDRFRSVDAGLIASTYSVSTGVFAGEQN